MTYRGFTIQKTRGGNYIVVSPVRLQEHACSLKVARKWIDAHILERKGLV